MNALRALQTDFQNDVLTRVARPGLFAREREKGGFDIYLHAYRIRLAAALRDNYPVLYLALGDEAFDALALAYIEKCPSRFRSIRWFGDHLADFMDEHPESMPHPALSDLARMDWALRQSFDAADEAALETGALAELTMEAWPRQCFRLRAPITLQALRWRVEPVWQALNQDAGADTPPPECFDHSLLVWRNGLECQWRFLDRAEAAGLAALAAGQPFAAICETMIGAKDKLTPTDVALALRRWVEDGLLVRE